MLGPIATLGSMYVCPMTSGTVPHVGGPVSGPGTPDILANGKPATIMGDMCVLASLLGNSLAETEENQKTLQKEEGEPRIYNSQWTKEDKVIRKSKVLKGVTLRAHVRKITNGETTTFKAKKL